MTEGSLERAAKHNQSCKTCFFADVAASVSFVTCRRKSPQLSGSYGAWPIIRADNWCGEWSKIADKPTLSLPGKK